jgi:hypothetical protein
MSWGWMYHEASRFIEDEKRFILIKDMKGNGFRANIKRLGAWDN